MEPASVMSCLRAGGSGRKGLAAAGIASREILVGAWEKSSQYDRHLPEIVMELIEE